MHTLNLSVFSSYYMQLLSQDFFTAIRILLGNFKIQTIIWPWRTGKMNKNFIVLIFKIPKLSALNMKSDYLVWNLKLLNKTA